MIPNEITYNLHYDDVRGDFFLNPGAESNAYFLVFFGSLSTFWIYLKIEFRSTVIRVARYITVH